MDIPKDKIEIVPNGIDLVDYDNLPDNGLFRKRYNIKDDERIILYLGRIHKRKRIEILIKAYSLLFDDFDDFKLVIVGPDDGYMDYLKKIVSKESLTDKVLFTGPIYGKNKLEVYTDADIFVYPSVSEIFGLSQLESLLCGTPIIVSDDSGCGKMTDDGLGYTFKEGNIVDLEKKMIYLIQNYENGISMVKNAKQLIKEKFEIEIVTKKFEIIYNHCIQNL
jgi:glycosyltransferase involved in cell wall biosynthesis